MLAPDERRELLEIAREAIVAELQHRSSRASPGVVPPQSHGKAAGGVLDRPGGAFVTLRLKGDLRGCIGYIESPVALRDVVREVARKAAVEDPRFMPLSPEELASVTIEISVLSPLSQIHRKEDVRVGEHGLVLERGPRRGLLLPQVAVEYGWDAEEFLENTARKAGLPSKAWNDPETHVSVFSAEVFAEVKE